jgi:hypothetical protein
LSYASLGTVCLFGLWWYVCSAMSLISRHYKRCNNI